MSAGSSSPFCFETRTNWLLYPADGTDGWRRLLVAPTDAAIPNGRKRWCDAAMKRAEIFGGGARLDHAPPAMLR
jgi:hypothetical protein